MKCSLPVIGMACSACSANVERKLNSLPGVNKAVVNLPGRSAFVDFDEQKISLAVMKKEINDIGYDLVIETDRKVEVIQKHEYSVLRKKVLLSWLLSVIVMAVSMKWLPLGGRDVTNLMVMILASVTMVTCGGQFYRTGWRQLLHGTAGMDTLVMLSTAITFLFSTFNTFFGDKVWGPTGIEWHTYFDASCMIITFVLTGRLLEEKAKDSTASSIHKLMGLTPETVRLVTGKDTSLVPLSTISAGDLLEVKPGEKIPVDGDVTLAGSFMTADAAYVDESMITGEPTPAEKKKGDKVLAGTIPSQGYIRLRAREIGENTALGHIIRMVQEAQGSKAPVQRVVDGAVRVFVPVVASLSVITFLCWWIIGGNDSLPMAIMCAVSVLVIACPCAMGLATPTALMVGIGKAAEKKLLIKDASSLENMRKVNAIVFDKTGTITIPDTNIDFTKSSDIPLEEREQLRPNVIKVINELHDMNIETFLMSGDKEEAVRYWAEKIGIDHYHSGALPGDKEQLIRKLHADGKIVAMVGDGINDTRALALADVGIAMGGGTDVAMDVAQVTMMGDDLTTIPDGILLSRKTVTMIWQNLFWAFCYNIVCIPLAAGILYLFGVSFHITPMWAGGLMALSGLSVVLNSLRLRFVD